MYRQRRAHAQGREEAGPEEVLECAEEFDGWRLSFATFVLRYPATSKARQAAENIPTTRKRSI